MKCGQGKETGCRKESLKRKLIYILKTLVRQIKSLELDSMGNENKESCMQMGEMIQFTFSEGKVDNEQQE